MIVEDATNDWFCIVDDDELYADIETKTVIKDMIKEHYYNNTMENSGVTDPNDLDSVNINKVARAPDGDRYATDNPVDIMPEDELSKLSDDCAEIIQQAVSDYAEEVDYIKEISSPYLSGRI